MCNLMLTVLSVKLCSKLFHHFVPAAPIFLTLFVSFQTTFHHTSIFTHPHIFPFECPPDSNFIMTNRSRGTTLSGSSCLLEQRRYLPAHSLRESELLTWQSTSEPWHRRSGNSVALRISEPFQLADLCHFYWNVMNSLNKSIRLKETHPSCSFNGILDSVSVRRGCHNMDW